jgi:WD40 repeat protein
MVRLVVVISVVISVIFMGLIILVESPLVRTSAGLGRLVVRYTTYKYTGPNRVYNRNLDVIDFDRHMRVSVEKPYPLAGQDDTFQVDIDDQNTFTSMCYARNDAQMCSGSISGIFNPNQIAQLVGVRQFWDGRYRMPSVSPDGTHISFGKMNQRTQDPPTYKQDVYVANIDGTHLLNLTESKNMDGGFVVWSPDSQQIAFACTANKRTLCISDIDGSHLRILDGSYDTYVSPASWSPDGRQILFVSYSTDFQHAELYLVNMDGSNAHRLLDAVPSTQWEPSWSPDGSKIAFFSIEPNYRNSLFVVNADGNDLQNFSKGLNGQAHGAVWSENSEQIAFFAITDYVNASLYMIDLSRGNLEKITEVPETLQGNTVTPYLFWIH